ncbi:DsbA family protein [Beggiatoa leptomitoformis]|uniref:Thioredoxin domain-containing protein n=1 Tax=Beggiatoa leptomitoformis TaxID=288004 RepID=A0A2N9YHJ8_9GAMM|nr:thioredoxin domain-containing protein [Beggiatoa leptomitoformis]ALG67756.1 thioredoxin domain-containing protein [Beggiatoa leptomitoformis]AUI70002.1 thioredoxin domain-containing protein [Beggiatoa leptomitoformis]
MFYRQSAFRHLSLFASLVCASLNLSAQETSKTPPAPVPPSQRLLFGYEGIQYNQATLPDSLRQSLYDADMEHFTKQKQIVDAAVFDLYAEAEAKKQGKDKEVLLQEWFKVDEPSEAEVNTFYEKNKERIPVSLAEAKTQIVQFLKQQKVQEKQKTLIAKVKGEGFFELLVAEPVAPIADIHFTGYPAKGNLNADITVVEFADYQCPHCKHAVEDVKKLMAAFGEKIKLVYMDYPINASGISRTVAEGAVCADQQGKFWEYHELAFEQQATLKTDSPQEFAGLLKLDEAAFKKCLAEPATKAKVKTAENEALRLGLAGTPSFFVNGKLVNTVELQSAVQALIK